MTGERRPVPDDRAPGYRDPRSWMVPFGIATMTGVAVGVLMVGLPPGATGVGVAVLLAAAVLLWAVGLDRRVTDQRVVVPVVTGVGLAGAGMDLLQPHGPGFVAGFMALAGLALRTPRRTALPVGGLVLGALAYAEASHSDQPWITVVSVSLGAGFVFAAASLAAANRDGRLQAERLLAEEAALAAARAREAALAERTRLARELHDILAHTLSGLTVQLEVTRLLAAATEADPRLVEQLARAQHLARDGMAGARRAVQALRGDAMPGPDLLPRLVAEVRAGTAVPIDLTVTGEPRRVVPEAGLALYRCAQEALTNVAKHAGRGARATVELRWGPADVVLRVRDTGGDGVASGLPSGGFGLTGMAERAALLGGELSAGPADGGGFAVTLRLPAPPPDEGTTEGEA